MSRRDAAPVRYWSRDWFEFDQVPDRAVSSATIRDALAESVHSHLMTDVPYGVLLSGGLDSSVIGVLAAARRAAEAIGTVHHGFEFTVQEGLDALRDVIWHIESFDTTTVRASTPMYLLARRIRATGVKMVLSGEGSDEIFGGYLYFLSLIHI